jgi:ABC-2 type transport system permease protein
MTGQYARTGTLIRLELRLDRVRLPVWVGACGFGLVASAAGFDRLYPAGFQREVLAHSVTANPGLRALTGPIFNASSTGGLVAWRLTGMITVALALLNLLLVVRHTRAEEESGRAELVGAASVGRLAQLTSALLVTLGTDAAFAALVTLGLINRHQPVAGSAALGLTIAATAWVFAGVAAVAAQVAQTARGASGAAGLALGLAFLLRAAGDVSGGQLSWLSPIGWAQQTRPYAHERWWVPVLSTAVGTALVAAAFVLVHRRDLGAGLVHRDTGAAAASASLAGPVGLSWRLHRGVLVGWSAGFAAIGLALGTVAKDVGDLVNDSPQLAQVLRRLGGGVNIVDTYLNSVFALMALVLAGYGIQAVLRIRTEEVSLRAESVLAGEVSRWRFGLSHAIFAAVGPVAIMLVAGLSVGLVYGLRIHDVAGQVPRLLIAGLAQVPAVWVLAGLALALVGLMPRASAASWAALGGCLVIGEIGAILQLPHWMINLSPFTHSPQPPAHPIAPGPVIFLTAIALVFGAAGLVGLRRRDIG